MELFLCFFSKFVLRFGRLAKHFLTFDKIAVAVLSEMKFMLLEDLFEEKRFLLKFAFFYIFCWIWQKSFRPIGKSFFSPSFSKWHSTFEGEQLNESWKLPLLKKIILSKSFSEFEWKTFDFLGKIYWQGAGLSNSQSAYLNEFFETNSFENIVNIIFTLKLRAKLFWTSSGKKTGLKKFLSACPGKHLTTKRSSFIIIGAFSLFLDVERKFSLLLAKFFRHVCWNYLLRLPRNIRCGSTSLGKILFFKISPSGFKRFFIDFL